MLSERAARARGGQRAVWTLRARVGTAALGLFALVVGGPSAAAFFTALGAGLAGGTTDVMTAPGNVQGTSTTDSGTVPVSWTAATLGLGIPVQGYFVVRIRTGDLAEFPACASSAASLVTGTGCNDEGVPDGQYRYRVTAVYQSWTEIGALSPVVTVINDSTPPAAPSAPRLTAATDAGASNSDGITNITAPVFTGTAEAGSTVRIYAGATLIASGVAAGGTYTIPSPTLTATTHSIRATATDAANLTSPYSANSTIVIDTTAPATPSTPALAAGSDTGRSATDRITMLSTPVFTGTAESTATVTLFEGAVPRGSGVATGGIYFVTSTTLTDGAHTITARATDLAGNNSGMSGSVTITVDATAPAAPSRPTMTTATDSGASNTDGITSVTLPIFTGTTEANSIITLLDNGTSILVSAAIVSGNYSVTSPTLSNGTHPITATATDVAGNVSAPSVMSTAVIDTVAPTTSSPVLTAASDTGISSTDQITMLTTVTVTGTTEAGATVNLRNGTTVIATGTADGAGVYTFTVTLVAGNRNLNARGTDLAGNVGSYSANTTITIDTTRPTVTVNQAPGQADPAMTSPVNFRVRFSEDTFGLTAADVTLGGTATGKTAALSGGPRTYTVSVSGMTSTGTIVATLPAGVATDEAGNTNTASTSSDNRVMYLGP